MIQALGRDTPQMGPDVFIHEAAVVIGRVALGARASVWPTAVIRGDTEAISVGDDTNVQDGAVVHADPGMPCSIGDRVTVGHRATVHGCTVEDECLIGIGATVLNGAFIGVGSIVGAHALVPEGMQVPPRGAGGGSAREGATGPDRRGTCRAFRAGRALRGQRFSTRLGGAHAVS